MKGEKKSLGVSNKGGNGRRAYAGKKKKSVCWRRKSREFVLVKKKGRMEITNHNGIS